MRSERSQPEPSPDGGLPLAAPHWRPQMGCSGSSLHQTRDEGTLQHRGIVGRLVEEIPSSDAETAPIGAYVELVGIELEDRALVVAGFESEGVEQLLPFARKLRSGL